MSTAPVPEMYQPIMEKIWTSPPENVETVEVVLEEG